MVSDMEYFERGHFERGALWEGGTGNTVSGGHTLTQRFTKLPIFLYQNLLSKNQLQVNWKLICQVKKLPFKLPYKLTYKLTN